MCGRFVLFTPVRILADRFGFRRFPNLVPRYNIAPTQTVAIVRAVDGGERECVPAKWGLIPSWAKDAKIGYRMINARADSAAVKPAYRAAFKRRRCLIPADGFYEWKKLPDGSKQPHYVGRRDREPLAFAGLWERWQPPGQDPVDSCTILTTDANAMMKKIHDRMPVIVEPDDYQTWLDLKTEDPATLTPILVPYSAKPLEARPVSRQVNSPRNDTPECLEPEKPA